ncbi:MAG TPA: NADH-quinone oxidoreductase subunit H [Methanoculleus sp.]|nr:NADH-quinone oxidoreductase subunit H [Methanoculleus sp.]
MINPFIGAILFVIFAPVLGGLVAGIDRKVTAHMQGRVGPPILQPFYDIFKLFEKESAVVRPEINFYIFCYLVFLVITGAIFFAGEDILLVIFALTLAHVFIVIAAYASSSPYAHVGAERELLMMMAVEPMLILAAAGMYVATGSFFVGEIIDFQLGGGGLLVTWIPLLFIGVVYILTIKLRKSPFDISTSHHAHQELVKGLTTEFSGPTLGMYEIAHLYELVFLLGFVWLFFAGSPLLGIVVVAVVYFLEILIDNTNTRAKWQFALRSAWLAALVLGVINLVALVLGIIQPGTLGVL